jgi:protoporphyrinogen oxidase
VKAVVVGGGVAGMTSAYRLMQQGHDVSLFESSPFLGGLVRTFDVGGNRLEAYYHHLFSTDTTIIALIQELGLGDELNWIESKVGWYEDGKIYPFVTPIDLLRFGPLPFIDRIKLGMMGVRLRGTEDWAPFERITCKDWIEQNVSKKVFEKVWGPLLVGKYGSAYDQVAMAWLWSKIHLRFASRKGGPMQKEELGYLSGSFARYIDAMEHRMRDGGVQIHLGTGVERITAEHNRVTGVVLTDGSRVEADAVIAAVPSLLFKKLAPPLGAEYEAKLDYVQWQGAVCMIITMKHSLSPIYWMNIGDRSLPFLALVEHTNFIGPEQYGGNHILYISNYLAQDHEYFRMSDDELWAKFAPALKRINPAFSDDWVNERWVFKAPYAQPVIRMEYSAHRPEHRTPVEGLYLETMTQIYPEDRGQNYSIKMGDEVARMAVEDFAKREGRAGAVA